MKQKIIPHLPLFVYGTLMPGFCNHERLLAPQGELIVAVPAVIEDHVLMATGKNAGFPYLADIAHVPNEVPIDRGTLTPVQGSLLRIHESIFDDVMTELDWLEGVDNGHYHRKAADVKLENGDVVKAWVYCLPAAYVPYMFYDPIIRHGSWAKFEYDRGVR